MRRGTDLLKRGFAAMQKGGVVMDVTNAAEAAIAEEAGAVAVMALERVPADIRAQGGVARMSDPKVIQEIIEAVTIPVMAKARIGHFVEAQVLQSIGVDMVDESEVLTPADPFYHIDKRAFQIPFVCGARSLGEATRRIFEGAAMVRTKGEAGTGNVVEAVRHRRFLIEAMAEVREMDKDELLELSEHFAQNYTALLAQGREQSGRSVQPGGLDVVFADQSFEEVSQGLLDVLLDVHRKGRLPVVDFAAGGIATPADAALMMQLGNDGVFVGSGIFKSEDPAARARAIVEAVAHFGEPDRISKASEGLGKAMKGIEIDRIPPSEQLQHRGW
ncbi:MAG: pyridoxal 5'-phosphate synthase lyase subunit PdxS [Methanobacteriota archaeon]